ncbi:MAG: ABC transporter substrate-binding protein [Firmicutes bacterium]|nr:ABC transporter substrate-binding protein [Bacillota bacterium]MDD3298200.1 ABC transporter substrate-binding protein [Bacillota bacterium]MDD3851088.1 ABC transporter substrate-binding protein [Bacillota bacterium]MDD4707060.1 ABC transporter substrate-binding protein [Bacillota bacterium]
MLRNKPFIIAITILLITGVLSGCANTLSTAPEAEMKNKYGGTYRMAIIQSPLSLDPVHAVDTSSSRIVYQLFETLVDVDSDGEVIPNLAKEWDISDNGLVYTFKLREGVKFHSAIGEGIITENGGREVTAKDWVWTFKHIIDPDTNSERAYFLDMIKGYADYREGETEALEGVVAKDEYTLEIVLDHPFAPFITMLAYNTFSVIPREDVEMWGQDFGFNPVGTGPFRFSEWIQDDRVVLTRNEDYWRKDEEGNSLPYLNGMEFRTINDLTMQWTEFGLGNLEAIESVDDPYYHEALEKYPDSFLRKPQMGTYFYGMNVTAKPFDNKKVRQAINYAIDRQGIIDRLRNGRATPAKGVLPPGMFGYNPDLEGYTYDPQKARKLLAEAGYPDGIEITLQYNTDDIHKRIAEAFQQQMKDAGIEVKLRHMDGAALFEAMGKGEATFFRLGWVVDYPDPDNFLHVLLNSANFGPLGNFTLYKNDEFDRLTNEARVESDPEERRKMYQEAEKIVVEEAPWLFVYHYTTEQLLQPYVKDYSLPPFGEHNAIFYSVWLDK